MKVALVHLSDIHFLATGNRVSERVDGVRGAIVGTAPDVRCCLMLVTGDIANSGKANEYAEALDFFLALRESLNGIAEGMVVHSVFIPGNHDCDFAVADSVREMVISAVTADPHSLPKQDKSVLTKCAAVQDEFFRFEAQFSDLAELNADQRLFYERQFVCGDKTISLHCYNTAWMSRMHELQGTLVYPLHVAQHKSLQADLTISLLHHPFNWFESNHARAFRNNLEASSDIIVTGHEHVADVFRKEDSKDQRTEYVAGGVLQQHSDPSASSFNLLVIDFPGKRFMPVSHTWHRNIYLPDSDRKWIQFVRTSRDPNEFSNTLEFQSKLADCGTGFSHRGKKNLTLYDVFVYPDLSNDSGDEDERSVIYGEEIVGFVADHNRVLITGADRAGKTSLAKILYGELQKRGLVPVLLDGENLKRAGDTDGLLKVVDAAVGQQYGKDKVEPYRQHDQKKKLAIIDDFEQCHLGRHGQNSLLECIEQTFGHTIVFANDLFQMQEFSTPGQGEESRFLSFSHCAIKDFGFRLRGRLIEKWMRLGHEHDANEMDIARRVSEAEHNIAILLGKTLVPSHPLFLLTMLQTFEAQTNLNTASGSYGYYYEVLITAALHNKTTEITLDTFYTFVSRVAYRMFDTNRRILTEAEFDSVTTDYQQKFSMRFSRETLVRVLQAAQILRIDSERQFTFRYNYIYYYFVARYIADNVHSAANGARLREQISEMVEKLYLEDFANITIFLVYLTKDEKTIGQLIDRAKVLYQEFEPCDLQRHAEFIHTLMGETPPVILVTESNAREKHRAVLDEVSKHEGEALPDRERHSEAEESVRFNVAFKTLQIIGQILKNFPGALPGDLKKAIALESCLLGLRVLRAIFDFMETNLDIFREVFSAVLREEMLGKDQKRITNRSQSSTGVKKQKRIDNRPLEPAEIDEKELSAKTDAVLFRLAVFISFGIVKKLSDSIGSEHLRETYREVDAGLSPIAIGLIELSIKLDHFQAFPESDILKMNDVIRKDKFVATILRRMVRDHLYLFPLTVDRMQKVCSELGIDYDPPKMLARATKKY